MARRRRFGYFRVLPDVCEIRASALKNDELGAKYVERVLKMVIKELDVGTLLAGDVGGGKMLARSCGRK